MLDNLMLYKLSERTLKLAKKAKNKEDLDLVIEEIKSYTGRLTYDKKYVIFFFISSLLITTFAGLKSYYFLTGNESNDFFSCFTFLVFIFGLTISIILSSIIFSKINYFIDTERFTKRKAVLYKNNFIDITRKPNISFLKNNFKEFSIGNQKNEIEIILRNHFQGSTTFQYNLIYYRYTKREYYATKHGTSKIDLKFDRISLFTDLNQKNGFQIIENKSKVLKEIRKAEYKEYKTHSEEFNKKFTIFQKEHDLSSEIINNTFMQTILLLSKNLSDIHIEFNKGKICISFKDNDIIKTKFNNKISNPDNFKKEMNYIDNNMFEINSLLSGINQIKILFNGE